MHAPLLSALKPMLHQLQRRTAFTSQECDAVLALPCRLVSGDANAYLFRDGDIPTNCCILLSGSAYRHKVAKDGSRQILAVHFAGDLMGLDQGLLDCTDHNAQCLSRSDVGFIPFQAVLDLGLAFPTVGRALWRDAFVDASIAREWILNVGRRDARQRIAHLICELTVRRDGSAPNRGQQLGWYMTQEQIGDATGLTPVHVNRTLQGMRGDGMIGSDKHKITILDWAALEDAGDFNPAYLHLPSGEHNAISA